MCVFKHAIASWIGLLWIFLFVNFLICFHLFQKFVSNNVSLNSKQTENRDYMHSFKVEVTTIFCELIQARKVIVSRPSLGNLLFRNPLFSSESVSNVDRLWNIYSLTADHIRVLLFVSFCIPLLICQWYSFSWSLTNTHQL